MAARGSKKGNGSPTIVRREEAPEAGHHGGAWKVAYADFVTAMMAFFLLMWLLNATTEDQRKGLADYFSPSNLLSHASSGTGQPFGGHTAFDDGALVSDRGSVQVAVGTRPIAADAEQDEAEQPDGAGRAAESGGRGPASLPNPPPAMSGDKLTALRANPQPGQEAKPPPEAKSQAEPHPETTAAAGQAHTPGAQQAEEKVARLAEEERQRREQQEFARAAQDIKDAVRADPALAALAKQLAIDITPQGLRIQLMDADRQAMFATGSAAPNEAARRLLLTIAPVLARLEHPVAIAGHTDAAPYPGPERTNWELSAERANAARRMLTEAGVPEARVTEVTGRADRELLLPAQPLAAANRRIAIVVLRNAPKGSQGPDAQASIPGNAVGNAQTEVQKDTQKAGHPGAAASSPAQPPEP